MRLVFAGTPGVAIPALDAIAASPHELVAVVTRPDAPAGRGRASRQSHVAAWAERHDVPALKPQRPREPEFLEELAALAPDCCPVVAYGALVPRAALDIPRHGWVNLHFSLLPAWRGAAPVQHALLHGDEMTGATTFLLEEDLDTGPILGVMTEPIRADDTAGALLDRLAHAAAGLLVASLDGLESGEIVPRPQPSDGVSYAPKLGTEDAHVDWTAPAARIDRQVRATTPAPGAWTTFRGRRLRLGPVTVVEDTDGAGDVESLRPGALRDAGRGGVLVGTADRAVRLGQVQAEGRAALAADQWARGVRIQPDERFA